MINKTAMCITKPAEFRSSHMEGNGLLIKDYQK